MHTHNGFRQNAENPMSDSEFIDEFRQIVPYGSVSDKYGYVTTDQAARIHNLRLRYECTPPSANGFIPNYTDKTVRLQKGLGKFDWIPEDTMHDILGYTVKRTSYIWLSDVLKVKLLRWDYDKRKKAQEKRPVGRPRTRQIGPKNPVGRPRTKKSQS
jgi:hypothetical protein